MNPQGEQMHQWAWDLWPINRSLTGQGVRETIGYLQKLLPGLNSHQIASGSHVFDWTVAQEWHCRDAYIITPDGEKICDFKVNNLHLMGYSEPVNLELTLEKLRPHLYSKPDQPTFIPYITSYYVRRWGFCLTDEQLLRLKPGLYKVVIDSDLFDGVMNYADLLIEGKSDKQIFFSTAICHPSMANNELSGPVMLAKLGQWLLQNQTKLHFSYRLIFVPETIGALAYLNRNKTSMMAKTIGGYQLMCVGDDRAYSLIESPYGDNISDKIMRQVLTARGQFDSYSFLTRGGDERQYCAPSVRLPIAAFCRSKYPHFVEYHTSADNLTDVMTPAGLQGSFDVLLDCIKAFERQKPESVQPSSPVNSAYPLVACVGEPQLGKRGLYSEQDLKPYGIDSRQLINIITYCDGTNSEQTIADIVGVSLKQCGDALNLLRQHKLIV